MSQSVVTKYEVYRDAEKIRLEEITWEKKETGEPSLKGRVLIDGRTIENVTFKRDITSKAYARFNFEADSNFEQEIVHFRTGNGYDRKKILFLEVNHEC